MNKRGRWILVIGLILVVGVALIGWGVSSYSRKQTATRPLWSFRSASPQIVVNDDPNYSMTVITRDNQVFAILIPGGGTGGGGSSEGSIHFGGQIHPGNEGRPVEWRFSNLDGQGAELVIDGQTVDVNKGALFVVSAKDKTTQVEQLVIDPTKLQLSADKGGLADLAEVSPRIARYLAEASVAPGLTEPPHVYLDLPYYPIDQKMSDLIKEGMTQAQVKEIIGGPPQAIQRQMFSDPNPSGSKWVVRQQWWGEKSLIEVGFDDDNKTVYWKRLFNDPSHRLVHAVTAEQLDKELAAGIEAVKTKYEYNWVMLTGEVAEKKRAPSGGAIRVYMKNTKVPTYCSFSRNYDMTQTMKTDQKVTVIGRFQMMLPNSSLAEHALLFCTLPENK